MSPSSRKFALSLAVGLPLVLVSLLFVLVSPGIFAPVVQPVRNLLVDGVALAVSTAFNGRLVIGELTGSLLSTPRFRDVELRDAAGTPVLIVDDLRLDYDLAEVFRGRIRVRAIEILGPRARLEQEGDGRLNIVAIFSSPGPKPERSGGGLPVAIAFDRVVLNDGQAELSLAALPGVREVRDLSAELRGDLGDAGILLELVHLGAHALPGDVRVHDLRGGISLADGSVRLDQWRLETGQSRVTLNGIAPGGPSPADLRLGLDPLEVGDIGRLIGNDTLQGTLTGNVAAIGPPASVAIDGQIGVARGGIDLEATADLTGTEPAYDGELRIDAFDPSSLYHRPAFEGALNARLRISGAAIAGGGTRTRMDLDVSRSRFGKIAIEPSRVRFDLDPEGLRVHEFDLRTSVADVTALGGIMRSGDATLSYTVAARLEGLQPYLGEPVGGMIDVEGKAQGQWPEVATRGSVAADSLTLGDRQIDELHLDYRFAIPVSSPSLQVLLTASGGRFGGYDIESLTAEASSTREGSGQHSRFDVAMHQSDRFGARVAGTLHSADDRHSLTLERVEANVEARHWAGAGPLKIGFAPGALSISPFRLEHDEESVSLSGGYRDGSFQTLSLALEQIDLDAFRQALALPEWVSGRLNLLARAEGPFDDPEIRSKADLSPSPGSSPPPGRVDVQLGYSDGRATAVAALTQDGRTTGRLEVGLPLRGEITPLPVAERLSDGPLALRLDIDQPDLAALSRTLAGPTGLTGTLTGQAVLEGTWAAGTFESSLDIQGLGIGSAVAELRSSPGLRADFRTAGDLPELREAVTAGSAGVALHDIAL
ncbi:MAG: hypothetical protein U9R74_18780 [Pseudomonadota bacterium]|nr:hypothetical protein [Pseudomonadota bacterium]